MDDEIEPVRRRRFLQATGAAGGSLALASVGDLAAADSCGDTYDSSTDTGSLDGAGDSDEYTFSTTLSDPCEIVYSLTSPDPVDFDLYLTVDGRTPSPDDYDYRSAASGTDERIVLDGSAVYDGADYGVLVYDYEGYGDYTLDAEEYGSGSGDGGTGNTAPHAEFWADDTEVYPGQEIEFDAYDSYDSDGSIASYEWTFGDGDYASGEVVSHSYDSEGTYSVELTVEDDDGATDSASLTVDVQNVGPTARVDADTTAPAPGETVNFDGRDSEDPDGSIVAYDWEFGDGADATGRTAEHAYDEPGYYDAKLTVRDDDGVSDTATVEIGVVNENLDASFTVSPDSVGIGETISVDASGSSDPDDAIRGYEWDFGDGATATGVTATHSYQSGGSYTVTLTVTGEHGFQRQATRSIEVTNEPPTASVDVSSTTPEAGQPVTFDASGSSDPDGAADLETFEWTFPGGLLGPTTKTGEVVTHEFDSSGAVDVTLTVTDRSGAKDTATVTVDVQSGGGGGGGFW